MTFYERFGIERKLRQIHGWLGALILPWIILAGFTGFYMNHEKLVLSVFPKPPIVGPADFVGHAEVFEVSDAQAALAVAEWLRPGEAWELDKDTRHLGRTVYTLEAGNSEVIVDRETGFVWLRDRYRTTYIAPDGTVLDSALRWSRILSSLHQRGWIGTALGKWLADGVATSLVVFGLSGMVLFYGPRLRRRRNRRARLTAQQG